MKLVLLSFLILISILLSFFAPALYASSFDAESSVSIRSRAAHLEQNGQTGKAGSMRIRINSEIRWNDFLSTLVEIDLVESIFENDHSDGVRFNNQPLIPDAPGLDINQVAISSYFVDTDLTLGRQKINQYNERFIGSVSMWQNEQTFDAVTWHIPFSESSSIHYRYIDKAHRIFGDDAGESLSPSDGNFTALSGQRPLLRLGKHDHNTHSIQLDFEEWDFHKWSAFYLDLDNESVPAQASKTIGARYRFKYRPSQFSYQLHSIVADQERIVPERKHLRYAMLEFGLGIQTATIFMKLETLEGNGNQAFITPLATLHGHQGFADQFLVTPTIGIRDRSVRLLYRSKPWRFDIRYHLFKGDSRSLTFGDEWDAEISLAFNKVHHLALELAYFKAAKQAFKEGFVEDSKNILLTYSYTPKSF